MGRERPGGRTLGLPVFYENVVLIITVLYLRCRTGLLFFAFLHVSARVTSFFFLSLDALFSACLDIDID